MIAPVLDLPQPSWLGRLLGAALLLLSLASFALFIVTVVLSLVPPLVWGLLLSAGVFLLLGVPALLFAITPRLLGGPIGLWLRVYTRTLAARTPALPMPWSRFAGLGNAWAALTVTLLAAGLGLSTLLSGSVLSPDGPVGSIIWVAGAFILLIGGEVALVGAFARRMRRAQMQH
jgi:hypothetical protein